MVSLGDWTMYSRSDFNGLGRVVIRNRQGNEFIIEGDYVSTDGDASIGASLGEHMWIDSRSTPAPVGRRLQEAEPTAPSGEAEPTATEEAEPELHH